MSRRSTPLDDETIQADAVQKGFDRTDAFDSLEALLDAWSASDSPNGPGPGSTHALRGQPMHPLPDPMLAMLEEWSDHSNSTLSEGLLLGEGGMAVVYLADQQVPPRQVAVKRLRENTLEQAKQLFSEALLTGSLEHPNIIPVHEIRIDAQRGPEVVLKRVEGVSLLEAYEQRGGSDKGLRELLPKMIQVCNALEYAHARGIIHRDVKTENIMIGQYGEVYLLDWGIAVDTTIKSTNCGTVGTPHYIAPEMVSGEPGAVDGRTDVYLLGATLHYLLVGKPRHDAPTSLGSAVLAMTSAPYDYPQSVFQELGMLANRSCALKPEDRPQSVTAFRLAIEDCLMHWDAMTTVRLALPDCEFVTATGSRSAGLHVLVERYDAAVLRLQTALSSWPQCKEAAVLLTEIRLAMVGHYLDAGDATVASLVLDQVEPSNDADREQTLRLRADINAVSDRESRVYQHAANNDITGSSRGRRHASIAMLGVVAIAAVFTAYQQMTQTAQRTAAQGLGIWLLGASVVSAVIFVNRGAMLSNAAGRRALIITLLAPLLVTVIRVVVYVHGLDPRLAHPIETFAVAHVCATAVEIFPRGVEFAIFASLLGIVGLCLPHFAYVAFITALLSSCAGFILQWERSAPPGSTI
jgi:eukaryotic-like serine/threonine-protein kinase